MFNKNPISNFLVTYSKSNLYKKQASAEITNYNKANSYAYFYSEPFQFDIEMIRCDCSKQIKTHDNANIFIKFFFSAISGIPML